MIDLEATVSKLLRADPDIIDRIVDRVWLTMPASPTFPAILIRRIGGAATVSYEGQLITDQADLDLHVYGGSRVEAQTLAHIANRILCGTRVITVRPFTMQRVPDNSMPQDKGRDRERYILSVRCAGHDRNP